MLAYLTIAVRMNQAFDVSVLGMYRSLEDSEVVIEEDAYDMLKLLGADREEFDAPLFSLDERGVFYHEFTMPVEAKEDEQYWCSFVIDKKSANLISLIGIFSMQNEATKSIEFVEKDNSLTSMVVDLYISQ